MGAKKFFQKAIGTMLVALLLAGCAALPSTPLPSTDIPALISPTGTPIPPTNTPIPIPPTAAFTPVPPTDTPTDLPPTKIPTKIIVLATSINDIVGTWYSQSVGQYLRFYEDGFLHQSRWLDTLDTDPYVKSEIWFEGTQMHLKEKEVSGVPSCGDAIGIYEVRLYPEGDIQIMTIKDSCSPRAGDTALKLDPVR